VKRTPLTVRGAERLRTEYHAARETQSFIEGRIKEIEARLSLAEIIDVTTLPQTGKVVFGATVELESEDGSGKVVYQIVGEDEADIRQGLVSITSPIARALVGKSVGDVVDVTAPGGTRSYEVVAVRYV
jgi:transcription elongation factor GreA